MKIDIEFSLDSAQFEQLGEIIEKLLRPMVEIEVTRQLNFKRNEVLKQ